MNADERGVSFYNGHEFKQLVLVNASSTPLLIVNAAKDPANQHHQTTTKALDDVYDVIV